jgi:hypothetical protein
MAFQSDFEGIRGSIWHYFSLSFIDSIVSELLTEKIHIQSYSKKRIFSISNPSMLVIPSKPFSNNQKKPYTIVVFDKCSFYKKIIGRLGVPSWDSRIKLESLTTSHNLILIDHLRATNHHTTIQQQ